MPAAYTGAFHDAAAVLVEDGQVLAALEEERVSRIKHTNRFPLGAIDRCLHEVGWTAQSIDVVAYFFGEHYIDSDLAVDALYSPGMPLVSAREVMSSLLNRHLDVDIHPDRITFVRHHDGHAASTYFDSGFRSSLVAVIDGRGDDECISVLRCRGSAFEVLRRYPASKSLGVMYQTGTQFLGFRLFDEYKVMGLAAYGDPVPYRRLFESMYELEPDGQFELDVGNMEETLLAASLRPRRQGAELTTAHCDFAASLQEALERIVFHVLDHFRLSTGEKNLCLAGGVAQNCTLNGRLASSALFDRVFVHPASHDAGAALGAALFASTGDSVTRHERRATTSLGTSTGDDGLIERTLERWAAHVQYERCDDVCERAASALAAGAIVGWVQGRSEFGPRALGQRNILADPRPVESRERVNALVKKREEFRPFAPAVTAEAAASFFEIPPSASDPEFMVFAVPVRPACRHLLRAVTHVDGSARVQVVSSERQPLFWTLIDRFGSLTGVPVLLSTSFNNFAEPIVDTVADAVRCFVASPLDLLFVGSFVVRHTDSSPPDLRSFRVKPLATTSLHSSVVFLPDGKRSERQVIRQRHHGGRQRAVLPATYRLLAQSNGELAVSSLLRPEDADVVLPELAALWEERLVDLLPLRP